METIILIVFVLGYIAIATEHFINVNKAASALITAVICWTLYVFSGHDQTLINGHLLEHLGDAAGILFFLLGAMTIVELIDGHNGFDIITKRINTTNKRKLLWIVCARSFILSAILDNLTTTIVMLSLVRKLIDVDRDRLQFAGMIVIAANAGGAWSPIGDVTTTMLWIGGQITAANIILQTFIPSVVCMVIPTLLISLQFKGNVETLGNTTHVRKLTTTPFHRNTVFWLGVGSLIFVPIFKTVTHLPPYMGILFGLGVMWIVTELMHSGKDEEEKGLLSVNHALKKIDTPSILFFLGILLSIAALQATGVLSSLAGWMSSTIGNEYVIVMSIGLLSALVDNVPVVAAVQGMFTLDQYPTDHYFWEFLAYCTGTGGSALIIGSAAGVAAMGLEKVEFFWYLKKIGWLALMGYFAGALVFILQHYL